MAATTRTAAVLTIPGWCRDGRAEFRFWVRGTQIVGDQVHYGHPSGPRRFGPELISRHGTADAAHAAFATLCVDRCADSDAQVDHATH